VFALSEHIFFKATDREQLLTCTTEYDTFYAPLPVSKESKNNKEDVLVLSEHIFVQGNRSRTSADLYFSTQYDTFYAPLPV